MPGPDTMFFIFIPCSVIYMVFVIIYITRESYKLKKKLIESGSFISAVPMLYINRHMTAVSPNGAPPPPPYSLNLGRPPAYTTQTFTPQLEAYTASNMVQPETFQSSTNLTQIVSNAEHIAPVVHQKDATGAPSPIEVTSNSTQTTSVTI